jgi:hypothetical protein
VQGKNGDCGNLPPGDKPFVVQEQEHHEQIATDAE